MKLSRKQVWFIIFNPPAWVYILGRWLVKDVAAPFLLVWATGVRYLLMLPVAFLMWDYRNKVTRRYVPFRPILKTLTDVNDTWRVLALLALIVLGLAVVALVGILLLGIDTWTPLVVAVMFILGVIVFASGTED